VGGLGARDEWLSADSQHRHESPAFDADGKVVYHQDYWDSACGF